MTSICGVRYILKSCPFVSATGLDWTCVMVLTLHFQKRNNPSSWHSLRLSQSHCHVACAVMAHHMKAQLNCSAGDALSQRIEAVLGSFIFVLQSLNAVRAMISQILLGDPGPARPQAFDQICLGGSQQDWRCFCAHVIDR